MAIDQPTATIIAAGITTSGVVIAAWLNSAKSKIASGARTEAIRQRDDRDFERFALGVRVFIYVVWAICIAISIGYLLYYASVDRPTKLFVVISIIVFPLYISLSLVLAWLIERYRDIRKIRKERAQQTGADNSGQGPHV